MMLVESRTRLVRAAIALSSISGDGAQSSWVK